MNCGLWCRYVLEIPALIRHIEAMEVERLKKTKV